MHKWICILLALVGAWCLAFPGGEQDTASVCSDGWYAEIHTDDSPREGMLYKRIFNSDLNTLRVIYAPQPKVVTRGEERTTSNDFQQRLIFPAVVAGVTDGVGAHTFLADLQADTHPRGYFLHLLRRLII